jgi:hypothetical protein
MLNWQPMQTILMSLILPSPSLSSTAIGSPMGQSPPDTYMGANSKSISSQAIRTGPALYPTPFTPDTANQASY